MMHPGKKLIEEIRDRNWTQKQFAVLVGKKNSEVNELIKGKRNITIQRDYILSQVLGTPEKYWINMQIDYDYEQMKQKIKEEENEVESFEVVEDLPINNVQEIQDIQDINNRKENIERSGEGKQEELEKEKIVSEQVQSKNNIEDFGNTDVSKSEEISEEDKQRKKEIKKIFINF